MSQPIMKSNPIVVALQLDESDASVLAAARYLSKQLHAPLELVHAVHPLFAYASAGDLALNPYYGYELNFSDNEAQAAKSRMSTLVQSLDDVPARRDGRAAGKGSCLDQVHAGKAAGHRAGSRQTETPPPRFL